MKKLLMTLSLMSLAGAAAFGVSSLASGRTALEVKADGDPETYITMSSAAFTNIGVDTTAADYHGYISPADRTWWNEGYSHFALDDFLSTGFNDGTQKGYDNESWRGTLRSRTWTQKTRYIYFQLGAAKNDGDGVRLEFRVGTKTYTVLNDTFNDGRMLLRYIYIPEEDISDEALSAGVSSYVDIVDQRTNNWGLLTFGYLHPNATKESTADAMRFYLNSMGSASQDAGARVTMYNHYYGNSYLRSVFYGTVAADVTDGFDTSEDFLSHWYFDHRYYVDNGNPDPISNKDRHFDKAISTGAIRPGDTQMPFNKTGDGFFRGWYENDSDGGFIKDNTAKYRFISRPFVVSSTNYFVSVKMGGTASLHVIDATIDPNGQAADLAWIDNKVYSSGNIGERIYSGFNTCTMVRHVINLHAYAGRTVQLAIADVSDGGWAAAYFDELKVNVAPTSFKVDEIVQATTNDGTFYSVYADQYVNSNSKYRYDEGLEKDVINDENGVHYVNKANAVADETDVKAAHDFLDSYYGLARATGINSDVCNIITSSDDLKTLVGTTYKGLSDGAKHIVCASDDYRHVSGEGDWFLHDVVIDKTVGQSIAYIASRNGLDVTTYNNLTNGSRMTEQNGLVAFTAILTAGAIAAIAFFLKRRKHQAE